MGAVVRLVDAREVERLRAALRWVLAMTRGAYDADELDALREASELCGADDVGGPITVDRRDR